MEVGLLSGEQPVRHVPFIGKHRPRPKLCAVCHEDATHVEVAVYKLTIIDKDSNVRYEQVPKGTYYCDEHTGMVG